jgi:hypothetical protein
MNHVSKMNRTRFVNQKFFSFFDSLHFSVGRVSIIASPSEKKRFKVSMRSKVTGFDGTFPTTYLLLSREVVILNVAHALVVQVSHGHVSANHLGLDFRAAQAKRHVLFFACK